MHSLIFDIFQLWLKGPVLAYGFAEPKVYEPVVRKGLSHASLSAFLKTEADIQVKFGGFLEQELLRQKEDLTVHAELNTYTVDATWWADLSVHDVSSGALWTEQEPNPVVETVRAVIEIKFANFRDPNWPFANGHVKRDLEKLSMLQGGVARLLLIMDESGEIARRHVDATRAFAERNRISILSNNQDLIHLVA